MPKSRYLSAKEASELLNISTTTLYSYVSRGLLRSESTEDGSREKRYYREDVEKLLARKQARQNPEFATENALHWGMPLMDSAITLIEQNHLYYRGMDATRLAINNTAEEVASLLWKGTMNEASILFDTNSPEVADPYETMLLHLEIDGAQLSPIQTFQVFLPIASTHDLSAYDLRPATVAKTGARIFRLMSSVAAGEVPENITCARMLQQGWCPHDEESAFLLNVALVLCADHEFNASSFTARVTASAGANPYQVVMAGLNTLQGTKHGGYTEQVEAFLSQINSTQEAKELIATRLRRGESIPGFGHNLYPNGDPRAECLLNLLQEKHPQSDALQKSLAVIEAGQKLLDTKPNLDFALATLGQVLELPAGGALAVFALGRTIGWIGHAIEQYQDGRLIRPRARYTGKMPETE